MAIDFVLINYNYPTQCKRPIWMGFSKDMSIMLSRLCFVDQCDE